MKTVSIVRWQTSEDVYTDVADGQVPRVGDPCFLHVEAASSQPSVTVRGFVQRVKWSVEAYAYRGYNRVVATVEVAEASDT